MQVRSSPNRGRPDTDTRANGRVRTDHGRVAKRGATEALVAYVSRVYAVVREDFRVDVSPDAGFATGTTAMRIKGRFNIAAPTPGKSLRTATVTP